MGCCCSVGSKARPSRRRRHMSFQTEFLQMHSCAWAFEPLESCHGHPWAWGTSQNTHGHSWECLELGECPLLGSLGEQCMSHSFGLTLYSTRDPGGTLTTRLCTHCICIHIHPLFAASHSAEKNPFIFYSAPPPQTNTPVVAWNVNEGSSCFQKFLNSTLLAWSVSTWTRCSLFLDLHTRQAAAHSITSSGSWMCSEFPSESSAITRERMLVLRAVQNKWILVH